jgi:hypothetical protein
MSVVTEGLHRAFLDPLGTRVLRHSKLENKPLCVDLALPLPPRLRVYMYTLVGGVGTKRPNEFKGVLRVPGQAVGKYGSFDFSDDRLAVLVAYRPELDVFVLWDASLHPRFKNGGNIQVRDSTVFAAAAIGRSEQTRVLSGEEREVVIACQSWTLGKALEDRVAWTAGVPEAKWATFQS